MKTAIACVIALVAALLAAGLMSGEEWAGVDESVIKKFSTEAGRTPGKPLLNFQGDVLLLCFLLAGTCGGFVAGYYYREVFGPGVKDARDSV